MCNIVRALVVAGFLSGVACAQERRFGVVEIGGSGVKASVVEIVSDEQGPQLSTLDDYPAANVNPAFAEQASAAAEVARERVSDMSARYGLSPPRIYVLGTSGLQALAHADALRSAIDSALAHRAGAMIYVSAADQARFGFEGVVNCARMAHRRASAAYVDIGSADITGAMAVRQGASACGHEVIATFGAGDGVKTIARAPEGQRAWRIDAAVSQLAGVAAGRDRIYLGGGVVWALTTFVYPGDNARFTPLRAADIAALRRQLDDDARCITDPIMAQRANAECRHLDVDMSRVTDAAQRARASADHSEIVTSIYTLAQLRTGAILLEALSERLDLAHKRVFFARTSERAWLLGFLLRQEAGEAP